MNKDGRDTRNQFIFGPLAQIGGYPMDMRCDCTMQFQSTKNNNHDDNCELWLEKSFWDQETEWDPQLQRLIKSMSVNPYENAEEFIWDGDTPVVSKVTAQSRVEAQRATFEAATLGEILCPLEDEAHQAIINGADEDPHGFVHLPDGSYADCEARVTYRKTLVDGEPTWTEEYWDDLADEGEADLLTCTCTPQKHFYCQRCQVQREADDLPWEPWFKGDDKYDAESWKSSYSSYGFQGAAQKAAATSAQWHYSNACQHTFETFRLPGAQNRNIKISAVRTHTPETMPDFGLYAASCWYPQCVATFIPWTDYGLPTCTFERAAGAIVDLYEKAEAGQVCEVGCMGGHGRTGTILAALAIISDDTMTPAQAIAWVRSVHCKQAIESEKQEWWIEWFAGWHRGTLDSVRAMPVFVPKATVVRANTDPKALPTKTVYQGGTVTTYHADGTWSETQKGVWCNDCKRVVYTQHNVHCPFEKARQEAENAQVDTAIDAAVLAFDPTLYEGKSPYSGNTANARRRNAKRANRRAAARRKASLDAHS